MAHLRTFALIVSAHPYCVHKFTCHIMHRASALNTKLNIVIALLGFNDLERSVTPIFLFRKRFYLQLSLHCTKMDKTPMWEVKKNFKISVHGTWNPAILRQQSA